MRSPLLLVLFSLSSLSSSFFLFLSLSLSLYPYWHSLLTDDTSRVQERGRAEADRRADSVGGQQGQDGAGHDGPGGQAGGAGGAAQRGEQEDGDGPHLGVRSEQRYAS